VGDVFKAATSEDLRSAAKDVGNWAEISLGDRRIGGSGSGDVDIESESSAAGDSSGANASLSSSESYSADSSPNVASWSGGASSGGQDESEYDLDIAGKDEGATPSSLARGVILNVPPRPPENDDFRELERSPLDGAVTLSSTLLILKPAITLFLRPRGSPKEEARDKAAGVGGESCP
jgi:hypothetical protein